MNTNTVINHSTSHFNLSNDKSIYIFNSSQFDFAILVNSFSGNETLNANMHRYVKVFVTLYSQEWLDSGAYIYDGVDYDLVPCPEGRFLNYTEFTNSIVNLTGNYMCTKDT